MDCLARSNVPPGDNKERKVMLRSGSCGREGEFYWMAERKWIVKLKEKICYFEYLGG